MLTRHPGNIFFNLFDLVNDLGRCWFQALGLAEIIFGSPELAFVHHDGAKLQVCGRLIFLVR